MALTGFLHLTIKHQKVPEKKNFTEVGGLAFSKRGYQEMWNFTYNNCSYFHSGINLLNLIFVMVFTLLVTILVYSRL